MQFGPKAHRPVNQWCAYQRICTSETLKFKRLLRMTQEVRLAIYKTALLLEEESTVAILLQSLGRSGVSSDQVEASLCPACLSSRLPSPAMVLQVYLYKNALILANLAEPPCITSLTSVSRSSLQRRHAFRPTTCILSHDMRSATRPVLTR